MIFENPILTLLDKIKKSKRVRTELIRQAVTKYPNAGSSYYQSVENRMIQGLSIDIVECKMKIGELTNKN